MPLDIIAKFGGDFGLQLLDAGRVEFDNHTGIEVDQVVVVLAVGQFEPRTRPVKLVALHGACLFEDGKGAIDRGL